MLTSYLPKLKTVLPALLCCLVLALTHAQAANRISFAADSAGAKADTANKRKEKGYREILKKATTAKGLMDVHQVGEEVYFEIPFTLLGKDLLVVNKISSVPLQLNDAGLNKGMNYESKVIRFSADTLAKKVWVTTLVPQVSVPAGDAIARSVHDNFRSSVIETFKIEAYNPDSTAVLVKVNKIFDGTEKSFNDLFSNIGLPASAKKDLSRIEHVKAFKENIVVRSLLSTSISEGAATLPLSLSVTTNIVLLPEQPMTPRFADSRIGYFSTPRWYFSDKQHRMEKRQLITRWRLEPKPEDRERYRRGELVEPQKPIIFYIDPATPPLWRESIKAGVQDWQKAFEQAGFKNAIQAREVTDKDVDFDVDDVRYSVIAYAASPKSNAMGPAVIDPRSGEILESDVIWWHNVMTSLHAWMRVQTGIVNPQARANKFSDELMGHAVRFVSSHEIGHTLGLRHNMGASHAFPVDSLRSRSFTSRMGGTAPSIMDYARFNYVAQPEDSVENITPQIGIYDKYAIAWGYKWLSGEDPHAELAQLNAWIRQHEGDPMYHYGEQQDSRNITDPSAQSEDLGDDAVLASTYGLRNLRRLMPSLLTWTTAEDEDFYEAGKLYMDVIGQWQTYASHVTAALGGFYLQTPVYGSSQDSYVPVPLKKQREAVDYLVEHVVQMPEWLFAPEVLHKTFPVRDSPLGPFEYGPYNTARSMQNGLFYSLFMDERLLRLLETEMLAKPGEAYTSAELFQTMHQAVFAKTRKSKSLSLFERMTQKNYVDVLIVGTQKAMEKTSKKELEAATAPVLLNKNKVACNLMSRQPSGNVEQEEARSIRNLYFTSITRVTDVVSEKRAELQRVQRLLEKKRNKGDQATRAHYADLVFRIKKSLAN